MLPFPKFETAFLLPGLVVAGVVVAGLVAACGPSGTPTGDPATAGEPSPKAAAKVAPSDEPAPELRSVDGYGFTPRACGFDLDDDGVVGEEEDCRICDGSTTDPDGDGVDEDLIYVSCDGDGADAAGCGASDRPCASLAYAWQIADGPDDGAEDVVCFRGTCRESETLMPRTAGLDGLVTVPATGSQSRDFERAADPAMLVGWDSDADGEYPPYDTDDVAVLDGWDGPSRGLRFDPVADRFELAHFTAQGHGASAEGKDSGLLAFGPGQGELSHLFLHDMHWIGINQGRPAGSSVTTVDLFAGKTRVRSLWLQNIWAPRVGGWLVRGAGQDQGPDAGPFRFESLTVTARGCDFDQCESGAAFTGFHLWGYLSGIEILDSHFDAAVDEWQPKPKGGPAGARFVLAAQCSQDWTIRHNLVEDFKNAVRVQGWAERYCDDGAARALGPVRVDRNVIQNSYQPWTGGDMGVYVAEGGDDGPEVVGDVWITHNVLSSPVGWESCVWVHGGNGAAPPKGRITVVGNTCAGPVDYHGAFVIGETAGEAPRFPHRGIRLSHNLVTGLRAEDPNLRLTYEAIDLVSDHNVYDPAGPFHRLDEVVSDLEGWRSATGLDAESAACLPAFIDYERGDYRLQEDDACAAALGAPVDGVEAIDQTGAPRPAERWSAGALEAGEPASPGS